MKAFILALTLIMITVASAQTPMPKTIRLINNANGETVGTATVNGNKLYLRDHKGELIGTIVVAADGTRSFYDPHGKLTDMPSVDLPAQP